MELRVRYNTQRGEDKWLFYFLRPPSPLRTSIMKSVSHFQPLIRVNASNNKTINDDNNDDKAELSP
jgi:hypothetical protein